MPKYNITVKLLGKNGNAFNLMGIVSKALKKEGASEEELEQFMTECTSGDYDNLLSTIMSWVNVE